MKTIILTIDVRSGYGDPAKEGIVGVFQIRDQRTFDHALNVALAEIHAGPLLLPTDKIRTLRDRLKSLGFEPIEMETQFVA